MNVHEPDDSSWKQYRRLIVSELERLNAGISALSEKIDRLRNAEISTMKVDIATLKIRVGLLGGATGVAGATIVEIVRALMVK